MIMSLGLSQENIRMEYIICLKASVILELIRYMCYSDPLKVCLLRAKYLLLSSGQWERRSSSVLAEQPGGKSTKSDMQSFFPKVDTPWSWGSKVKQHTVTPPEKRPAGSNASCSELMQNSPTSLLHSPDCQRLAIQWSRNHRNHSCAVQSSQLPKNYFHSLIP